MNRLNGKLLGIGGTVAGALGIGGSLLDPYAGFALACSGLVLGLLAYRQQKKAGESTPYVVVALGLGAVAMVVAMAFMILGAGV